MKKKLLVVIPCGGAKIWKKEPSYLFTIENYLKLLDRLRELSTKYDLPVRIIEKALFKKNLT